MSIKKTVMEKPEPVNITDLFVQFTEQYGEVYVLQIEEHVFIYKALGRKAYKDILTREDFNDVQKEEMICYECLLYPDPEEFDWDNCDAGIPTQLRKAILKNSYLESLDDQRLLRKYYANEMYEHDNQITCIINEAFPNLDIEEIEQWSVAKTLKYLSRAEWKMANLRGMNFIHPEQDIFEEPQTMEEEPVIEQLPPEPVNHKGESKKEKLTPDNIGEATPKPKSRPKSKGKSDMSWEEFVQKFPEFANDSVMAQGIKAFNHKSIDPSTPVALQVPG